jgi:hypothetical protein
MRCCATQEWIPRRSVECSACEALGPELAARCRSCAIDIAPRGLERPSGHAPVIAEVEP